MGVEQVGAGAHVSAQYRYSPIGQDRCGRWWNSAEDFEAEWRNLQSSEGSDKKQVNVMRGFKEYQIFAPKKKEKKKIPARQVQADE